MTKSNKFIDFIILLPSLNGSNNNYGTILKWFMASLVDYGSKVERWHFDKLNSCLQAVFSLQYADGFSSIYFEIYLHW